jgi:hypothetical protein
MRVDTKANKKTEAEIIKYALPEIDSKYTTDKQAIE